MMVEKMVRKTSMECPLCGKTHEVEERKRFSTVMIKGEKVTYEEHYFVCENTDEDENEFETGAMMNANLLNARNAYRSLHGLLTSDEIVAIRESYSLSQVDLARLLGWGEATISRYESKAIQDEAYDTMLRLIRDDPTQALAFLSKNAKQFTVEKRQKIKSKIMEKIDDYGKEGIARKAFEIEYAKYDEPSLENGYTMLNVDKIEAMISYIAAKVPHLFKVKLMKMLWYSDALSYKLNKVAMTGMVYRHEAMGALPIGHYRLMDLANINVKEETSANYDSMLHIYPVEGMDYSSLSAEEKDILDQVISQFKSYKAKEIIDYMHEEKAYTQTENGMIIPFDLAGEIRSFDQ